MTWSPAVRKRVRALVEAIASLDVRQTYGGVDVITIQDAIPEAGALLDFLRERKPPAKRLPGESTKAKRERKRREHREATAAIYAAVSKRAGGKCESCGQPEASTVGGKLEMHHVLGGVGRRRQMQAVSNCMMVCRFCHGLFNGHPYGACNVVAWAERHGYPVPPRIRELADSVAAPRAAAQTDASKGER